ncbi:glucose-6-phosphate isomerase family protein [Olsenella sp. HMSC062G07]|uniref:glucose-6-phosphate isomerase family protein n=1 Tax=Olsenella sp. HMSC062G07 TaxID=1739330 RepID=UPI0008A356BF|nr:glucose-6-phosphate isomerase family protein [Olsenella sp. HMSC062G07]OFK23179.1 hypothetical protein HMPREF2826_00455 [Olsenella sp. HMSC062G07]
MDIVMPPSAVQPLGVEPLIGPDVTWSEKRAVDLAGVYQHPEALKELGPDFVAYSVAHQNCHPGDDELGRLVWGTTYVRPFTVAGECAMTHGHYHLDPGCDEYYFGLAGTGFLLLWDGADELRAEEIRPGSLHYIAGRYAHRIINAGDEVLAVAACYLSATQQDHLRIEREPFPCRCFCRDGRIEWAAS